MGYLKESLCMTYNDYVTNISLPCSPGGETDENQRRDTAGSTVWAHFSLEGKTIILCVCTVVVTGERAQQQISRGVKTKLRSWDFVRRRVADSRMQRKQGYGIFTSRTMNGEWMRRNLGHTYITFIIIHNQETSGWLTLKKVCVVS